MRTFGNYPSIAKNQGQPDTSPTKNITNPSRINLGSENIYTPTKQSSCLGSQTVNKPRYYNLTDNKQDYGKFNRTSAIDNREFTTGRFSTS